MDKSNLCLNPSDAMDRSKWLECPDEIGVTVIVIVLAWVEYELYVSGARAPKFTWIKGCIDEFVVAVVQIA